MNRGGAAVNDSSSLSLVPGSQRQRCLNKVSAARIQNLCDVFTSTSIVRKIDSRVSFRLLDHSQRAPCAVTPDKAYRLAPLTPEFGFFRGRVVNGSDASGAGVRAAAGAAEAGEADVPPTCCLFWWR